MQLSSNQQQQSDDEDFEGSGMGEPSTNYRQIAIPIQCHAKPHSVFATNEEDDGDDVMVQSASSTV